MVGRTDPGEWIEKSVITSVSRINPCQVAYPNSTFFTAKFCVSILSILQRPLYWFAGGVLQVQTSLHPESERDPTPKWSKEVLVASDSLFLLDHLVRPHTNIVKLTSSSHHLYATIPNQSDQTSHLSQHSSQKWHEYISSTLTYLTIPQNSKIHSVLKLPSNVWKSWKMVRDHVFRCSCTGKRAYRARGARGFVKRLRETRRTWLEFIETTEEVAVL